MGFPKDIKKSEVFSDKIYTKTNLKALHFADYFTAEDKNADISFSSESSGYTSNGGSSLDEKEAQTKLLSMQSSAHAGIHLPPPTIKTEPLDETDDGTEV